MLGVAQELALREAPGAAPVPHVGRQGLSELLLEWPLALELLLESVVHLALALDLLLEVASNLMTVVPPALCGLGPRSYTAESGSGNATGTDAGARATLEMVLELQEEERSPECLSKDRTYPRISQKRTSSQAESS